MSQAKYSEEKLRSIQHVMLDLPGFTSASADFDQGEAGVTYDDGSLQRWADRRYGTGLVTIGSALRPVG